MLPTAKLPAKIATESPLEALQLGMDFVEVVPKLTPAGTGIRVGNWCGFSTRAQERFRR